MSPTGFLLDDGRVIFISDNLTYSAVYDPSDDSWVNVGSVTTTRSYPTIVKLPNGKVYAMGGYTGGTSYNNMFVFDPSTDTWAAGTSMSVPRVSAIGGALPDGRLIIAGGWRFGGGPLSSAEIYDPDTNLWTTVGSLSVNHAYAYGTVMRDGRFMITGGAIDNSFTRTAISQVFDPNTNTFVNIASMNNAKYCACRPNRTIVLGNGKIVVGGGHSVLEIYDPIENTWEDLAIPPGLSTNNSKIPLGNDSFMLINSDSSQIYNTLTSSWSPLEKSLPTEYRYEFKSHLLQDGRVFMYGGHDSLGLDTGTQIFDPSSATLTAGPDLIQARSNGRWIRADSNYGPMLIGGYADADVDSYKRADIFNESTMTWESLASMNEDRDSGIGLRMEDGKVLVLGGYDPDWNYKMSAEIYNPQLNTWSATSDYDIKSRDSAGLSELPENQALLVGGYHYLSWLDSDTSTWEWEEDYFSSTRIYDGNTQTWSAGPDLSVDRYSHLQISLDDGKVLVLGGYSNSGTVNQSGEILDIQTMQWSSIAAIPEAVTTGLMHAKLFDGRIMIWGVGSGKNKSIIYDPAKDTWKTIDLDATRSSGEIVDLWNGSYLVIGGRNSTNKAQYGWDIFTPYSPQKINDEDGRNLYLSAEGELKARMFSGQWIVPRKTLPMDVKVLDGYGNEATISVSITGD